MSSKFDAFYEMFERSRLQQRALMEERDRRKAEQLRVEREREARRDAEMAQRQAERARREPPPPAQIGPSIIHGGAGGRYHAPAVLRPAEPAENVIHARWQDIMEILSLHMEPVYTWAERQEPGILEQLGKLEDRCRELAIIGDQEVFERSMTPYFTVLGQLVHAFLFAGQPLPCLDFLSLRFGGKPIRVHVDAHEITTVNEDVVEVQATEIPALLTATSDQLDDLARVKSVFPGAHIVAS